MTNAKDRSNRMKSLFGNVDRAELEKHLPAPAGDKARPKSVRHVGRRQIDAAIILGSRG